MAILRCLVFATIAATLVNPVQAANEARFVRSQGHLAFRTENSEWTGLRTGDDLPISCQLRTSPLGAVRIEIPSGELMLDRDTDLNLDSVERRIALNSGRFLIKTSNEAASWKLTVAATSFVCLPGGEVEFSFLDTIGVNVLKGRVQVSSPKSPGEPIDLNAPVEWVVNEQGESKSVVPTEAEWANQIRKRTELRHQQGLGQLIAKDAQSNNPVRLEIARYYVNVVLQPPVALVQIDQSFFNPFHRQEEGTFVFDLPEGASVSRFAMFVTPDDLIEGELIDRKRADQVYTTIVRSKRDPAILEQIGTNLFRMRVFPIFAHDEKRILLDYTVPLVADQNKYHFELPLISDLKPIGEFGISGTVHPPFRADSVSSWTHPDLRFMKQTDGRVTFSSLANNVQPPPSLTIDYRATEDSKPTIRTFNPDDENQYFVAIIPESANPLPKTNDRPIDLLVLLDTSGSARDLSRARLVARTMVNNLRPQDRWQAGSVDINYRAISPEWLEPRSTKSFSTLRKLDQEFSLGESRLDTAVEESLTTFTNSPRDRRRVIVYIGDGKSTKIRDHRCWDHEQFREGYALRPEFHAVKIGEDEQIGKWLQDGLLGLQGRGFVFANSTTVLRDLFEWMLAGMPSSRGVKACHVENVSAEDLFYDQQWSNGRELHVWGRRKPAKTVELKLELSDQTKKSFSLSLDDTLRDESVFTGRLWAKRKVDSLTRALRSPDEEYAPIVTLCQEWSLMSPYTAFLVLETEKDYERWNIPRSLRHRYWQPVGSVAASSLPESWKRRAIQNADSPDRLRLENELTEKRRTGIQKTLDMAQVALSKGNVVTANTLLYAIREYARLVDGDKYESLMSATRSELRRESVLSDLKLWQSLIDRGASGPLPAITPLLLSFSHGGVNPEFEERHPHWKSLLKPAPEFDSDKVPLPEFVKVIRKATGVPVITDRTSFWEERISERFGIEVVRHRDMSVRSLLDLSFFNQQITVIPERYLLRITTLTEADKASRMSRQVYPVVDLIRPNVLPRPERLANPYLADDLKNRRSIESRLKKLITVEFEDCPLSDALQVLSIKMGDTAISVDKRALSEESISIETPVSLSVDNLPASFVLDEVLQPLHLEHVNRDGISVVTTMTEADKLLETRIYSAAGLIDEAVPDPNVGLRMLQDQNWVPFGFPQGMPWGGGGMGGGMGGMFGGGMDEGGIGGMGAGMGGGGMGGAIGGAGPDIDSGQDSGVSEIAAPLIDGVEMDSDLATTETSTFSNQPAITPWISPVVSPLNTGATMNLIQQSTDGKWENIDGEGGSMTFHRPSFSFVIRQTQRVHKEIKETFAKLRRLPRKSRIGTAIYANRHRLDDMFAVNYGTLMNIIQQSTSAKWINIDGEGGTLTPHTLTESLVITQTPQIHEQIDQLFAQLRKARYLAESLPWLTSLEGIDDIDTFLDRPTITDLPRNGFDPKPPASRFADNLGLLSVRRPPTSTSQRWQHVIADANLPREKIIRRLGTQLELVLPNQTLRAEGPRAAMIYPGLTLIEIEDWGDAARQVADATFPWMPHRSNEELAQLFDVKVDSQEASTTTLQLAFPSHPETYLKVTFSKQTGHPEKLLSYLEDKLKYELQFTPKTVLAVDPLGKEIERWELLSNDTIETMPSFAEGFDDFVIVEPSKPDEPLAQARGALRRGDNSGATKILADLLVNRPQQPLINFLYAWSMAGGGESDAAQTRLMREALLRMSSKGPRDLLRLVSASSFPSIGTGPLREVFLTIPEEQRTEDVWDKLVELAITLERYDLALTDINRAIEVTKDESLRTRRRLLRVELLLKNRRPTEAEEAARALTVEKLSPAQLIELATIFGHAQQFRIANLYYEQYRGANLTRSEQAQAVNSKAAWLKKGEERWRLLLMADEEGSDAQRQAAAIILLEADQLEDAETIGKIADDAKTPAVRTQLLLHQIELTKDKQQAADIALELYTQKQITRNRLTWLIQLLSSAGRSREVVDILEKRLRNGDKLDAELLNRLSTAYGQLGRESDRTRATTQRIERSDSRPDNTPANRRMLRPAGGGGMF